MQWIKAPKLPDELLRSYYCKIYNNVFKKEFKKQVLITLDGTWQTGDFDTVIEWLDESEPNEPSIERDEINDYFGRMFRTLMRLSNKHPEIISNETNDLLKEVIDLNRKYANKDKKIITRSENKPEPSIQEDEDLMKAALRNSDLPLSEQLKLKEPQPLQETCTCTPDQTTGHTGGKCNVCGKEDIEEAAIQHADSLHKKGSSELAGNGKLTENDCWENAYFNFKEGYKASK